VESGVLVLVMGVKAGCGFVLATHHLAAGHLIFCLISFGTLPKDKSH
jgi:hypothetical protein